MTIDEITEAIEGFDESFMSACRRQGMSMRDTQRALLDCPLRKELCNAAATLTSISNTITVLIPKNSSAPAAESLT